MFDSGEIYIVNDYINYQGGGGFNNKPSEIVFNYNGKTYILKLYTSVLSMEIFRWYKKLIYFLLLILRINASTTPKITISSSSPIITQLAYLGFSATNLEWCLS